MEEFADFGDYLRELCRTYDLIKASGRSLYVAREREIDDWEGHSSLFALPDPKRKVNDDKTVVLLEEDIEFLPLPSCLNKDGVRGLKGGSIGVYLFNYPFEAGLHRKETFNLGFLRRVLEGKTATLWYNYFDID